MGVKSFHYHERDDSESYDGCIYIYDSVVVEYVDKKTDENSMITMWKFPSHGGTMINHVKRLRPRLVGLLNRRSKDDKSTRCSQRHRVCETHNIENYE